MKTLRVILFIALALASFALCACEAPDDIDQTTTTTTTSMEAEWGTEPEIAYDDYVFEEMPIVRVDCEGGAPVVSKEEYVDCTVSIECEHEELELSSVKAGIRTRGNSSLPKDPINNQAPYRIKFEKKQTVLGLNSGAKCKSWVLLKPEQLTGAITFFMGQMVFCDDGYYCSDSQLVELYLNSEYRGVYLLCEQSQINENRVDVFETPEGYTSYKTGYFLEMNNYPEAGEYSVYTNFGDVPLVDIEGGDLSSETLYTEGVNINKRHYTLKNDELSSEQYQFINKYFNNSFTIAYSAIANDKYYEMDGDFNLTQSASSDAKELISRYIDIDSLVNMYIIQEITMNTDVGAGSFYISLDMTDEGNGLLTFECPWDFSWGYRSNSRYTGEKYEGLSAATFCSDTFWEKNGSRKDRSNPWLILFMKAEWFRDMVRERWTELKDESVFENTFEEIARWESCYGEAFSRHETRWNELLVKYTNRQGTWLKNRIEWLENKFFTMDK